MITRSPRIRAFWQYSRTSSGSATATPGKLNDTTALTQPATMKPGHNSIPVKASAPTSYLLVWIPTLGTTNGESRSGLAEITVQAAS